MKIAFLACPETLPGSPTRRPDAFEHDLQLKAVRDGLGTRGEVQDIDWRAPLEELLRFDVAYLGTPWNYTEARDEFLERLEALEAAGVMVCNPVEVIRWNSDKSYLQELAKRGAPSIPTFWPENPGRDEVMAAMDLFGTDRVVVKRRVGAGAVGQRSFTRDALPDAGWQLGRAGMIQPFLPSIQTEGEMSFIFIAGKLSHALIKRPRAGDYRIQSLYGGSEEALDPDPADRAAAQAVIALLPFARVPLYARIDMVRLDDGTLALIEAELIEPYLYPRQGPRLGEMLAAAIRQRLG